MDAMQMYVMLLLLLLLSLLLAYYLIYVHSILCKGVQINARYSSAIIYTYRFYCDEMYDSKDFKMGNRIAIYTAHNFNCVSPGM